MPAASLPGRIYVRVTRRTPEFLSGWHDDETAGTEVYGGYGVISEKDAADYGEAAYGTVETALDGTRVLRFTRAMIETCRQDGLPHLYTLHITICTGSPLLPDWAEADVLDGGVCEGTGLEDTGRDLFTHMANLTGDDFPGEEPERRSPTRLKNQNGDWSVQAQNFTEIAAFGKSTVDRVEQMNAALQQTAKRWNSGAETTRQMTYWQQMRQAKRELNVQGANAGTAESGALTALATNISDMADQGRKTGRLNEAQIAELTAMANQVQAINDALSGNVIYELAKKEYAFYEDVRNGLDIGKGALKAADKGMVALKQYIMDTARDTAMDFGKDTLFETIDIVEGTYKFNHMYWLDKGVAWVADHTFGGNMTGMVEERYQAMEMVQKEFVKFSLDPERYVKATMDNLMFHNLKSYENHLNGILDTLSRKYGMGRVRTGRTTSQNTNCGKAQNHHDPEGIVYEAVLSNPVQGATAALYQRTESAPEGVFWDAWEAGQLNPQVTEADGHYHWEVPEGEWQVRVTAPEGSGLADNTSADHPNANLDDGSTAGWLPVMPVQLGIHIPLVSTRRPEAEGVTVTPAGAEITFSLYMDISTLTESVFILSDGTNEIPFTVSFPNAEADPMNPDRIYATTVLLAPADGQALIPGKSYSVTVKDGTGYNNLYLAEPYVSGPAVCEKPACAHGNTELRGAEEPGCTEPGYSGDLYCADCGAKLEDGTEIAPSGHADSDPADEICDRCGTNLCASADYADVPAFGNWAHSGIDFCIARGLMGSTGTDALTFEPNTKVSRAMVASILYRMAGSPAAVYAGAFTDVKDGKWYTAAVEWCAGAGIASGKGDGRFDPSGDVTRQELAVFMMKMAEYLGKDTSGRADLSGFADASSVPGWAKTCLEWAVDAKLISGKSSGGVIKLASRDSAARSEFASIVMRFVQNIAEG